MPSTKRWPVGHCTFHPYSYRSALSGKQQDQRWDAELHGASSWIVCLPSPIVSNHMYHQPHNLPSMLPHPPCVPNTHVSQTPHPHRASLTSTPLCWPLVPYVPAPCCPSITPSLPSSSCHFKSFSFFNKFIYFIYLLFLAVLGLCCCALAFSSCGERGLLFAVCSLLTAVASLVAEHRL